MPEIFVDGKSYEVEEGQNLLAACLSAGLELPYFCWHPELGSVGACRQCAVTQYDGEDDDGGRIVMACMTAAEDGARISIESDAAKAFRRQVIEWLMLNHPHDCPVCDEGGECHLQDVTVMTGHVYRRTRFPKRTFTNQDLGPFVYHEMNRCITCYRCVRFYGDYAGGRDLREFGAHDHVYFGRVEDGTLESEFSGNLVEVCPTGVFTDKVFRRRYVRKWDLAAAPSVCTHCGLGCNTLPGERDGIVRRVRNRYHRDVNGYFLCDRGRYGFDHVNRDDRPAPGADATTKLAELLRAGGVAGVGSPRASVEANYALRRVVGPDRFFAGVAGAERDLLDTTLDVWRSGAVRPLSVREVRDADAVLVLGEDLPNTAPVLALAVRRASRTKTFDVAAERGIPAWHDLAVRYAGQGERSPVFLATPAPSRIDDAAAEAVRLGPAETARLGFAVAHVLDDAAPAPDDLDEATAALAGRIAEALRDAKRPAVISGTSAGRRDLIEAAAAVAIALGRGGLHLVVPEANGLGAAILGGGRLGDLFAAAARDEVRTAIVLENDLFRRAPRSDVEAFLERVENVVVLDHATTETGRRASLVVPVAGFAEAHGCFVSSEGRAQRAYRVVPPPKGVRESREVLRAAAVAAGREDAPPADFDALDREIAAEVPGLSRLTGAAPAATFRAAGQKVARKPFRYSGRTARHAHLDVFDHPPPEDPDAPLTHTMEGYEGVPPAALVTHYRRPGWNSVQALDFYQREVAGATRGGPAGVRLFEARGGAPRRYPDSAPAPAAPPPAGDLAVVALPNVFGSDELAALAPAVRERAGEPRIALRPEDAEGLGEGDVARLRIGEAVVTARVRYEPALPPRAAGVPVGFPGVPYVALPATGRLER